MIKMNNIMWNNYHNSIFASTRTFIFAWTYGIIQYVTEAFLDPPYFFNLSVVNL